MWIGEDQFHLTEGNGIFINTKVLHRLYSPSKALIPNFVFMPSFIAPCDSLIYQKYILPIISYPLPFLIFHINPNGIPETEKPLIGTALHFRLPSAGFWSLPCRNSCIRHTAWRYEYPLHQKCRFPYLYLRFACLSNIISVLFPFKYPTKSDTLIFGGISIPTTRRAQHHKLKEKMERNLFAGSFHCVKI